ncbi:hypothetical protein KM92DES2_10127 [uncultured Desulfovibrio sp.]|uniref:Uncharacterized protein n=1 Tax=uncultured Desulfovibrio sp. TaxID=167968 RepID=A0A212IW53_9BACT|nr:hypothetical protein KM92DES2_10127 [uncultured Desulfovibrio sp.]
MMLGGTGGRQRVEETRIELGDLMCKDTARQTDGRLKRGYI